MRVLSLLILLSISVSSFSQKDRAAAYLEKYKDLAMKEMLRSGVPASITLAQGMLESNYGESNLCKNSNNHFGIKCKLDWVGEKVYHDDDESQECFRKYENSLDSYKDHSNFLKSRPHYASLFTLDPADYEGWCRGLKKAGYATESQYAERLIAIINNYNLNTYSLLVINKEFSSNDSWVGVTTTDLKQGNNIKIHTTIIEDEKDAAEIKNKNAYAKFKTARFNPNNYPESEFAINGLKVIYVDEGTSMLALAQIHNISFRKLLSYNDLENVEILEKCQLIFLEKKSKKGAKEFHIVTYGESLYDIAQKEGVRLEYIAELNNTSKNIYPQVGEKINLKNKADVAPKLSVTKVESAFNNRIAIK